PSVEFENRAVMGVRRDEEQFGEAILRERVPDSLHGIAGWRASEVEADECDLRFARFEHECASEQGVENADARFVVACGVTPHGEAGRRRDVCFRRSRFQFRARCRACGEDHGYHCWQCMNHASSTRPTARAVALAPSGTRPRQSYNTGPAPARASGWASRRSAFLPE